jgi:hypothetical protein
MKAIAEFFELEALTNYVDWIKIFFAVVIHVACSEAFKYGLRKFNRRKQGALPTSTPVSPAAMQ